ncbi:hypothetical protein PybrP1_009235 [[Pythium] brassicae (nom. inval.)]|nr:hypothetical protein PybrP1_009235 [[Pythium] brassicae (nom. inval.)]
MDEQLTQFLSSVEASARRILKQQNKKQQELAARDHVALARGGAAAKDVATGAKSDARVTRDELRASYGAALIVQAPPPRSPARSESADGDSALPRLHAASPRGDPALRGSGAISGTASSALPAIGRSPTHQQRDALAAAKQASRDRRAAGAKLLDSPLYRSLAKSKPEPGFGSPTHAIKKALRDVDNVGILLRKMGLRGAAGSPSQRPDHAVERRMCNACWATPDKLTGCEHHNRVLPPHAGDAERNPSALVRSLELQGPKSWLSDDLFVKYRSEADREALWDAFVQLKEDEKRAQEEEQEALMQGRRSGSQQPSQQQQQQLPVVPVVTRHPVLAKFVAQIALENLRTHAETRKRNESKTFIFDVNHLWLTHLDHFNAHQVAKTRRQQRRQLKRSEEDEQVQISEGGGEGGDEREDVGWEDDDDDTEANALSDRRDEAAIQQGYSQIQSISTSRALQHAVLPAFDPSSSSFASSSRRLTSSFPAAPAHEIHALRPESRKKKRVQPAVYPLSLVVCGRWQPDAKPNTLDSVPGVTLTGKNRVLWWRYPHDEDDGGALELTKVVAMFARDAQLSSSNAILVSVVLALDSPLLSQLWFAWHVGSVSPPAPLPLPDAAWMHTPSRVSPCTWSLVSTPLQSRLDTLLPCTMMILNNAAQPADHVLLLDEPFGHRRLWPEMNADAFRQWWLASDTLAPNVDVEPQECSVLAAQPNATGVCGRFCWHSIDHVDTFLCRRRAERDYWYIVHNERTSGSNSPMYFAAAMTHEAMAGVHAAKLSAYLALLDERRRQRDYEAKLVEIEQKLEVGRLLLDAKRQEQKRIEQELAAAAARKLDAMRSASACSDAVLREWDARMQQSVVREEQGDWQLREVTADDALVVFYHSLNPHLPSLHRYSWERPSGWLERTTSGDEDASKQPDDDSNSESHTSRSDASSAASNESSDALDTEKKANDEAMAQITRGLLEDQQFLQILKDKLGLSALESAVNDQALASKLRKQSHQNGGNRAFEEEEDDDDALQLDWDDQMLMLTEESDRAKASLMATKMAKLQLLPPHKAQTRPIHPGEGWKRLKVSKLPRNFARSVYSAHTEGPRSAFINQPNSAAPVGMLDPADASAYEAPEFIPELRAHFVPKANADLQERKAVWAEFERTRPRAAAAGVPSANGAGGSRSTPLDELLEGDPAAAQQTMEERVSRAVLCARNNNLEGVGTLSRRCVVRTATVSFVDSVGCLVVCVCVLQLEDALDGGVDVNARDNYGNSLFILVCQQGNKRLVKFLLRRRADMNLQVRSCDVCCVKESMTPLSCHQLTALARIIIRQNMNGNTGLHYLVEYKHAALAEYIKRKGASDTLQNASGLTCYEGLSADALD